MSHTPSIPWDDAVAETVRHLQALIRCRTVNPPGNETEAAEYLAQVLREEGLDPVVIESAPGRGNMVVRLRGTGDAPPLLLLSHTDVVPVEPEHWTRDPFGGEVADGMVWGRGALDMKGIVAMQLMTVLLLKRAGVPLRRDVIFAATADEEAGGRYGIGYLVDNHPELVRAEAALSEFGGFNMDISGRRFYLIQAAEKGICQFRLRARGNPGHGSIPHADNAVVKLAEAVARLGSTPLPYRKTRTTEAFIRGMAETIGGVGGLFMRLLLSPRVGPWLLRHAPMPESTRRTFAAMFHNTVTPTILQAGEKVNVIPSVAEAIVDARILPGETADTLFDQVRAVIGEGYELEVYDYGEPMEQPMDTPLWELMVRELSAADPEARVVPYMLTGATDAKALARIGIPCYGFAPMKLPSDVDFLSLAHGHDERIPISALRFGLPVLFNVVYAYSAAQG